MHECALAAGPKPLNELFSWFGLDVFPVVTYPGFAASYGSGPDGTRLLVAAEDFGDAAVGDPQLSGDDAGPDTVVRHLHDLVSDVVR